MARQASPIVIDSLVEGGLQVIDASGMEADDVVDSGEAPDEQLVLGVEIHARRVALVAHHVHGLIRA
jgi:hypothetical protein